MSISNAICNDAAALNSEGAYLVESDRLEDAYECFAQALQILLWAEEKCAIDIMSRGAVLGSPSLGMVEPRLLPQDCVQHPNFKKCSFNNSPFYVYNEPLQFTTSVKSTPYDVEFYKATLLFNMGLVLHKMSNCVDAWGVYRAMQFYELSLECCKGCPDHPNCLEVSTAALNNKAHVFFDHSEFSTSREVLDTLLVTMILRHGRPLQFKEDEVQGILFNLYMLRMPTAAPVA